MITKRILILTSLLTLLALQGHGAAEEPHKAVFNIFTYRGTQSPASGYGFFIGADGTGIASYNLFRDADRAEIIDARGNKYPVVR
ncbi:MAG: serine protease, partial [Alloprevotella sp.]|nr:serine protease [Alloprevotella sp.]